MKLFLSDYDGTLFFQKPYSQEDISAIKRLQKEGHVFGLNTGRGHLQIAPHYAWDSSVLNPDLMICNSGAVIVDKDGKILEDHPIDFEEVEKIVHSYPGGAFSFSADGDFVLIDHPYFDEHFEDHPPIERIRDVKEIKDRSIHSLGLNFETREEAEAEAERLKKLTDLGVHVNRLNIDVNSKGFDKATGLKKAADLVKADEVYAIGDSWNDLPALIAADHGFLMSAAPEELQQKARDNGIEIVDSVAQAISKALEE